MARDCSTKRSPTHLESLIASACILASALIIFAASGGRLSLVTDRGCGDDARFAATWLPLRPRFGAIGAFVTSDEPHCGQASKPVSCCRTKSSEEANQPSNR